MNLKHIIDDIYQDTDTGLPVGRQAAVFPSGYIYICHKCKYKRWHRMVFQAYHGYLPDIVDHIDNDRLNNRIENLQDLTKEQNAVKLKTYKTNKTNYPNVNYNEKKGWRASMSYKHKHLHIGYYKTAEEAFLAFWERKKALHGEESLKPIQHIYDSITSKP